MKPWLRLTLITVTVGGGFTGIAITLQSLLAAQNQPPVNYVLMLGFMALFGFVTTSGLVFVQDPKRIDLLIVALAIQVPWVSSPLIAYKFAAGFQVCIALFGGHFYGGFRLGSDYQINFFQHLPWGAGINLFAVALLVLVVRATQTPTLQSTFAARGLSGETGNIPSSASATPSSGGNGEHHKRISPCLAFPPMWNLCSTIS